MIIVSYSPPARGKTFRSPGKLFCYLRNHLLSLIMILVIAILATSTRSQLPSGAPSYEGCVPMLYMLNGAISQRKEEKEQEGPRK